MCWSRVSPSPSRAPLPWLLSPPPPTPCRCHLPPPLVLSLHPGARPPRSHLGAEEGGGGCPLPRTPRGRRRPPAFPSPPTPSAALLSPPTSWRPERASRSVCACRWRWGLLGVDEGACAVAAAWPWRSGLAGGVRLGGACAPLALLFRLRRPSELPGPLWPGGGRRAGGGCLEVASVPPPVPHPVSPPSSSRAACTASPSPQLLLPPLLQVPSAFRRGGLKTPGGVPPVRLGVGAAGLWGVGRVPSRPSSPLTPLLLPGRGGGARSRAAQPLAAAAVGKGAPDPAVVSCRERGARGGVASLSRAVSGGGAGAPLGACGVVCVLAPRRGGGGGGWRRARPASKPTDPSQSLSLCPVYWPARGNPFSSVGRGWCCARLSLDGKEPKKTSYDS